MTSITEEDVQFLREMGERIAQVEGSVGNIQREAQGLVAALRTEFDELKARLGRLELELEELREAVEALQQGRGGSAGSALLDPRLLEKPGKFHGKPSEWRDWSESLKAFVAVADPTLAERMEYYSTLGAPVLKADMELKLARSIRWQVAWHSPMSERHMQSRSALQLASAV